MKEEESGESRTTSEEIRQRLRDQFNKAEFGSVDFQAASDYFALDYQKSLLRLELDNVVSAGEDKRKKISWESEVRIRETQIALLEREIESNNSRVPGYARAYQDLDIAFEDLVTIVYQKAEKKHPSDKGKQKIYRNKASDSIYEEINDLINSRQSHS